MKKTAFRVSAIALMFFAAGCGYRIGTVNPDDPIERIYVPAVENSTGEPGIAARATSKLIAAFQIDGTYEVVNETDADAILEVELTSYSRSALRYDRRDVTREYRLTLGADVTLLDARSRKVLWKAKRVEGEKSFFVTVNLPESERLALPYALEDLAEHLVERVTERW